MDGRRATSTCIRTACVDSALKIRRGPGLVLRNLRWLATEQALSDPLLGRPLLEAQRLNTRKLLAAAADRFADDIEAERLVSKLSGKGESRVSQVMEGVLYADGGQHGDD